MSLQKLIAISLLAACAFAQTDRAIVTGTVTDSSGAAIPGAKVTARNVATNVGAATETTSSGDFTIPALPVGTYEVRIEKQGFKAAVRSEVILNSILIHVAQDQFPGP